LAASSGAIVLLAPSNSWALELETLDTQTGESLLRITRAIYPHATMDDAVYALVVKDLDAAASGDPSLAEMLRNGAAGLNEAAGGDFGSLDAEAQTRMLVKIQDEGFFQKIRGTAVVSLYNNELAWAHFGYEGPSFNKGGYLKRGFDDLQWLPGPPAEASPPAA
jgi:hypothetical protein